MNTTDTDTVTSLRPVWREVLATSFRALEDSVAGVRDDQWDHATPCSLWTVTQVAQHAAGDQLAYAKMLGIGNGPAYDPFSPSGSVDGTVAALVQDAIEQTAAAWATVSDDTETVPTPLPHGDLPTPVAAVMGALDAAVHAWDIAIATGRPSPLDDELAGHLLAAARGIVEPLRQWGAYAPVVEAGGGASATPVVDELLRYLGRDPR
ncbi:TIGR03086 family metal-binding protein [Sphaerisporangium sp. TRM90804]|uniref:TIGR03086 family metal-binding protein n=1 Tax=Sphaerisporangium sp. TRM90804 TaxID=3031113 RepID=UPI00244D3ACC|nr:TIGR03086 family metal-binding protein [Sphaerisporangium sp. TRM90804]MDH2428291.1 TIGR03086 family metal-binding protein [Sphaerisporangium sp. TRM90804]